MTRKMEKFPKERDATIYFIIGMAMIEVKIKESEADLRHSIFHSVETPIPAADNPKDKVTNKTKQSKFKHLYSQSSELPYYIFPSNQVELKKMIKGGDQIGPVCEGRPMSSAHPSFLLILLLSGIFSKVPLLPLLPVS